MDRLSYLYHNGKEISFDNESKLVFMSDIHRGDGTYYDALLQNRNIYKVAMKYYYRNKFTYVEVGDGDELWKSRNCRDIARSYEDIYELFNKFRNENRLYMVYGNHDIIKNNEKFYIKHQRLLGKTDSSYGREFLNFISATKFYEGITFKYKPLGEKFLVTHGHQVDIINCKTWIISRFLVRYVWKFLYGIAGFKDPISPAINNVKGDKIDRRLESWARENKTMIICGHTHNSRMPMKNQPPYFNDGCCVLPDALTSIEVENGKIALVKWSIEANEQGVLCILRDVISGPISIEKYLLWNKNINEIRE